MGRLLSTNLIPTKCCLSCEALLSMRNTPSCWIFSRTDGPLDASPPPYFPLVLLLAFPFLIEVGAD
jgi:hypothetical protein